uniref:Uncharacterized protein n=1 Tax=Anguilla anguilla TaxID=7936 RepID=A0A0E9SIL0_ANGAN
MMVSAWEMWVKRPASMPLKYMVSTSLDARYMDMVVLL